MDERQLLCHIGLTGSLTARALFKYLESSETIDFSSLLSRRDCRHTVSVRKRFNISSTNPVVNNLFCLYITGAKKLSHSLWRTLTEGVWEQSAVDNTWKYKEGWENYITKNFIIRTIHLTLVTISKEHGPWESTSHSSRQEFPSSQNKKVQYSVHKSPNIIRIKINQGKWDGCAMRNS